MVGNREIVEAMSEAFNAGDFERVLEFFDPEIEYHELPGMPGAGAGTGVFRGIEALVAWYTEFLGGWEAGFESALKDVVELENGQVITVEHWRGRGAKSGVDVEMDAVGLHTLRDGRITELRYFRTEEEARETAAQAGG